MQRVTADSNIWISGLIWREKPHEFLNLARAGKIELAISDALLDEFTAILRAKFEWAPERLDGLRAEIATFTKHVTPSETLDVVPRDADDNRIVECAVAAGSDVIVSGDADLLSMGSFRDIKIQRVTDFLSGFQARSR